MEQQLYLSSGYKNFIKRLIHANEGEYGFQTSLSERMDIQRSYLSQVLGGKAQLNADQIFKLGKSLEFDNEGLDHLMALWHIERATDPMLREHYRQRIERNRRRRENLSRRIKKRIGTEGQEFLFYSHWVYFATYMATLISSLQTAQAIARALIIDEATVRHALTSLAKQGLMSAKDGIHAALNTDFHLPRSSPFFSVYLRNWRDRAIENSARMTTGAVHYSGIYTVSLKDAETIAEICRQLLVDSRRTAVASSKETEIVCLNLDFFTLGSSRKNWR